MAQVRIGIRTEAAPTRREEHADERATGSSVASRKNDRVRRSGSGHSASRGPPPRRSAPGSGRIARPTHSTPRSGSPGSLPARKPPPIPRRAAEARRIATPTGGIHVSVLPGVSRGDPNDDDGDGDGDGAADPPTPRTGSSHSIPNSSWIEPSGHPPSDVSISGQPVVNPVRGDVPTAMTDGWMDGRNSERCGPHRATEVSASCSWSEWLRACPGSM